MSRKAKHGRNVYEAVNQIAFEYELIRKGRARKARKEKLKRLSDADIDRIVDKIFE